ncbi:MAG TPA: hypothetical protein VJH90_04375 [archaeon]|nr:hypothetical protein [archaeon]
MASRRSYPGWCVLCRKKAAPGIHWGRMGWHMHVAEKPLRFLMLNSDAVERIIKNGMIVPKDDIIMKGRRYSSNRKMAAFIGMCRSCSAIVRKHRSLDEKDWPKEDVTRYYNCKPCNSRFFGALRDEKVA